MFTQPPAMQNNNYQAPSQMFSKQAPVTSGLFGGVDLKEEEMKRDNMKQSKLNSMFDYEDSDNEEVKGQDLDLKF